jgi:hypothetical protein
MSVTGPRPDGINTSASAVAISQKKIGLGSAQHPTGAKLPPKPKLTHFGHFAVPTTFVHQFNRAHAVADRKKLDGQILADKKQLTTLASKALPGPAGEAVKQEQMNNLRLTVSADQWKSQAFGQAISQSDYLASLNKNAADLAHSGAHLTGSAKTAVDEEHAAMVDAANLYRADLSTFNPATPAIGTPISMDADLMPTRPNQRPDAKAVEARLQLANRTNSYLRAGDVERFLGRSRTDMLNFEDDVARSKGPLQLLSPLGPGDPSGMELGPGIPTAGPLSPTDVPLPSPNLSGTSGGGSGGQVDPNVKNTR